MVKKWPKDLSGMKFGMLTVVELVGIVTHKSGKKVTNWLCKCECGNTKNVVRSALTTGNTRSCGCLRRANTEKRRKESITKKGKRSKDFKMNYNVIEEARTMDLKKQGLDKKINGKTYRIGQTVKCISQPFQKSFEAKIEKFYNNSVLVGITKTCQFDNFMTKSLKGHTVIRNDNLEAKA
jgi:uncharacterized protein YkvS